ncbi:MAG: cellulase family glycosylhydrolase [Opitutaceae bacterium]|nr:cellulase family glycosylhydrolase [Cytophagales bacterium]
MNKHYSLFVYFFIFSIFNSYAQGPVSRYGKLKLNGLQLSSECSKPVQLKGLSTHGPQWFSGCYSNSSFLDAVANDWKADVFRLALYVEEGGYVDNPTYWKNWVDNMVDEVGKRGMYCLIDWHVLADGDPNKNIVAAKEYWDYMSRKHGGKKHVIYEICNEPNERYKYGASAQENEVNWARIKLYAETIIPIIRKNDPESIIIVGTPYWSNRPWRAAKDPIIGINAYNVMYTFHFYAGTPQHTNNLDTVKTILNKIPVFATEWGLSEESGTGIVDEVSSQNFANVLGGANPSGILVSWCVWSYADKDETSALLKPGSCGSGGWNNRTQAGIKTYELINNPKKDTLTCFPEPKITRQPASIVVKAGDKAMFSVIAAGEKLTFQWQKSTNGINWTNIGTNSASFTINSTVLNDKAYYRVKISNYMGYLISQNAYLNIYSDGPYYGIPFNIPGKIEAEAYDIGGQNKSYFDKSAGNTGNSFRTDDVDIQSITDSLGGYGVGYLDTDEWLDYSVNVLATASYEFRFRVGSALSSKNFKILVDGVTLIPQVNVSNLGNWDSFSTVTVKGVNLTKGMRKIRFYALTDGFNFNYFEARGPQVDCNNEVNGTAKTDACGYCSGGNTGLAPMNDPTKCYIVTSIEEEKLKFEEQIYPNPFSNSIHITSALYPATLQIINLEGKILSETTVETASEIDLSQIKDPGIYQLKLITYSTVSTKKIVKK